MTVSAFVRQRSLAEPADPHALFAALSDRGRRADTMLFEQLHGPALILDRAALRLECRGQTVCCTALTVGGEALLDRLSTMSGSVSTTRAGTSLTLTFAPLTSAEPAERLRAPTPFSVLRALAALPSDCPEQPFGVALLGVTAFDHVDFLEDLPPSRQDPTGFPDYLYWVAESLLLCPAGAPARLLCTGYGSDSRAAHDAEARLDNLMERCGRASPVTVAPDAAGAVPVSVDIDDDGFAATVTRLKEHIAAGDVFQIVPSRCFSAPCGDPFAAYGRLRAIEQSPYRYYLAAGDAVLVGASPETSVRVTRKPDRVLEVEVKPIAGTRPRGASPDEDDRLEADMRLDPKEVAEHMMLVDLARNDVARVSASGTRRVAALLTVERYARVMHLVSSVKGRLADGLDALHAFQACLNVGTLSGAPKIKATSLLRHYEETRRGAYGGAIGWINGDGELDSAVVIRTALVRDGTAHVRAGAGVVRDSDPYAEAAETGRKAAALLSVLAGEAA